jgi:hypothetical protein
LLSASLWSGIIILIRPPTRLSACSQCKPIDYPAPDGKLSFDILTSVSMTNTNHAENQPIHLRLPETPGAKAAHTAANVGEYAGLLGRVCPAAVYEYVDAESADADAEGKKFVINSQNCSAFFLFTCSPIACAPLLLLTTPPLQQSTARRARSRRRRRTSRGPCQKAAVVPSTVGLGSAALTDLP